MNRIHAKFQELQSGKRKALIPYIMAGDPDLEGTESLVLALEEAGADIIELGVPFSDPIADGPTIQEAGDRSLKQGTSLRSVLRLTQRLRKKTSVPLVLMTYYNLIYQYDVKTFVRTAARCGVDGVIIPDLPPEEAADLIGPAREAELDTIFLLAPTSTPERIHRVASVSSGFLYYVSMTGITGAKLTALSEIQQKVSEIRQVTSLPISVGFGISSPRQAAQIARWADGIIVGSALVRVIAQNRRQPARAAGRFLRGLRLALR